MVCGLSVSHVVNIRKIRSPGRSLKAPVLRRHITDKPSILSQTQGKATPPTSSSGLLSSFLRMESNPLDVCATRGLTQSGLLQIAKIAATHPSLDERSANAPHTSGHVTAVPCTALPGLLSVMLAPRFMELVVFVAEEPVFGGRRRSGAVRGDDGEAGSRKRV